MFGGLHLRQLFLYAVEEHQQDARIAAFALSIP
jgi:hypothetical protein